MANNLGTAQGAVRIDTSGLKNADIALRSAGGGLINFGQQAVGAFAAVVGEAAKFEKEMDFVQAVTNATADEMKLLEDAAIDLAQKGIFGPVELAQAFVDLVKAGANAKDIIEGVGEASVNLAIAADVEVPFAGENLINTLNTFGLEAEDATRVADLLAGAANASSIELTDLFLTFKYAGPIAASLGVEIDDLSDAISLLGLRGIKGSTAGTSLRQILLNLNPATERASDRMKELGIITEDGGNQLFDASGKAKQLDQVLQILNDSMKDMTQQERVEAMRDLFGVRPLPSALILMEQAADGFAAINDEIERTTAADVAAARMDNLDGAIKNFKATLSAAFVEGGNPFLDGLKEMVQALTDMIRFFNDLPSGVKTFIIGMVAVIGIMSLLAGAFLLTIGNIVRAVRVVAEIKNAFALFSGAARGAAAANGALGASFLLNPWVLAAVAIAALVVGLIILYKKWEPFRNLVNDTWEQMKVGWERIKTFISDAWQSIQDFFSNWGKYWGKAKSIFSGAVDEVENFFRGIGRWVADAFGEVVDFMKAIPGAIGGFLSSLPGIIGGWLGKALDAFTGFLSKLPYWAGYWLGFVIGRVIRWGYEFFSLVVTTGMKVFDALWNFGIRAIAWAIQFAQDLFWGIVNWIQQLPGRIIHYLTEIWNALSTWFPIMVSAAWQFAMDFLTAVVTFFMELPGRIWNYLVETIANVASWGADMFTLAVDTGNDFLNGIIDIITGLPGEVMDILVRVVAAFNDMVSTAFNAAKDFAGGLWDGFKAGLGMNSPSYISRALDDLRAQTNDAESNLSRSIRSMHSLSRGIPEINAGSIGITPALAASGAGGVNHHYHAPLVGEAEIRDRRDIYVLSNDLEVERNRRNRGRGGS